jgi:hypothetical protein
MVFEFIITMKEMVDSFFMSEYFLDKFNVEVVDSFGMKEYDLIYL